MDPAPQRAEYFHHLPGGLRRRYRDLARLGGCVQPIRVRGEMSHVGADGIQRKVYSTRGEIGGVLLVACGNRRASRCPACAEVYRADTFHLIRAGLLGGDKGVPDSVREHPRALVTLTAPSFGPVHAHRTGRTGRLVGHSSTAVTELVYRKQIRPVLQGGAVVMDQIFK
ncbi:replication initiator [Microtetraspora glauca]|uniref:Replication initiator n=1 Tax=Microtetraspora glauca TaxID=1996 RepID=A0ABV3GJ01_MICGL